MSASLVAQPTVEMYVSEDASGDTKRAFAALSPDELRNKLVLTRVGSEQMLFVRDEQARQAAIHGVSPAQFRDPFANPDDFKSAALDTVRQAPIVLGKAGPDGRRVYQFVDIDNARMATTTDGGVLVSFTGMEGLTEPERQRWLISQLQHSVEIQELPAAADIEPADESVLIAHPEVLKPVKKAGEEPKPAQAAPALPRRALGAKDTHSRPVTAADWNTGEAVNLGAMRDALQGGYDGYKGAAKGKRADFEFNLSEDDAVKLRKELNSAVAEFGLTRKKEATSNSVQILKSPKYLGAMSQYGTLSLDDKVAMTAAEFLAKVADGKKFDFSKEADVKGFDSLRVLLHEAAHSSSKMAWKVYEGAGAVLEEATAELAGRRMAFSLVPDAPLDVFDWKSVNAKGSYHPFVHDVVSRVHEQVLKFNKHATWHQVRELVTDASIRMRGDTKRAATADSYINLFVSKLDLTEAKNKDKVKESLAKSLKDLDEKRAEDRFYGMSWEQRRSGVMNTKWWTELSKIKFEDIEAILELARRVGKAADASPEFAESLYVRATNPPAGFAGALAVALSGGDEEEQAS